MTEDQFYNLIEALLMCRSGGDPGEHFRKWWAYAGDPDPLPGKDEAWEMMRLLWRIRDNGPYPDDSPCPAGIKELIAASV